MMKQDDFRYRNTNEIDTFNRLYNLYYQKIYRFVYRLSGDPFETEDILQETFIRLDHCLRTKPDILDYITAWLYRVASNLWCNQAKRKQKHHEIVNEFGNNHQNHNSHSDNNVETRYIQTEKISSVRTIVKQLPTRDQILLMLYQDGLSYAEMAKVIKVKKTSIGKLLSRAIEKCAKKINEGEEK
ncbi:RNA polymerase sigma factor [Acidobacteriota bacterium]